MNTNKKTIETLLIKLEELFGSRHIYYQPPENLKMEYPAIRCSKSDIVSENADNIKYLMYDAYDLVVISKKPDDPVIKKILGLPYTSYDRHYVSDGLNHDIIRIYW